MRFHVDVQIHSKYSRATAKNADLENLALWGRKKGITVVGTGDFTHPAWLEQIKTKLVPAEPGLFRLRPEIEYEIDKQTPTACARLQRFLLEVEISTIYKKGDKVRKVHHLIFVPDIEAADRLVAKLSRIGNLASDGRPILGLDSRDLLEITLETGPHSYLIPAHIWTPWFAALGSKSGFDSIDECYGDLAEHVFAVETGLSSDPAMNWRIASLDRFRLVSNSDAHSPPKIGREATTYDTGLDYFAMLDALKTGEGFVGTVEFFPEEGKYHEDGHRQCGVRLTPEETKAHGGACPACGKPVTVGVLHRIAALADRSEAEARANPPPKAGQVSSLVPLPEILGEVLRTGPASKGVTRQYERLLDKLGPELAILERLPLEDIAQSGGPMLGEAIRRLRAGQVIREAGYDGEYGVIRLFEEQELSEASAGGFLFEPAPRPQRQAQSGPSPRTDRAPAMSAGSIETDNVTRATPASDPAAPLDRLDPDQQAAARLGEGAVLIEAGPGSGKTRTLTHRIAHLVAARGVAPASCLAITFTRRAAQEMRDRLNILLPGRASEIAIHTFHSLGLALLRDNPEAADLASGFRIAGERERLALLRDVSGLSEGRARSLLNALSKAKRSGLNKPEETDPNGCLYEAALARNNWVDFDDLVTRALQMLEAHPQLVEHYRARYRWIAVDEFQDVDEVQYRLLTELAGAHGNLCVIGDARQAIYGFRGADAAVMGRFRNDYPDLRAVSLKRNYRSTGTIVTASAQLMAGSVAATGIAEAVRDMAARIEIHNARTERAEAEFVVHRIEQLLGGHSFFSIDSGRSRDAGDASRGFADIAILYRTEALAEPLVEALMRSGIPFQKQANRALSAHRGVAALLSALDRDPQEHQPFRHRLEEAYRSLVEGADEWRADLDIAWRHLDALAANCGNDRARFDEAVEVGSEADLWDARAGRVSLMTLHAAKGLEFPVVFIVGLENSILPLYWGRPDDASLEEERRLFYVGMTRAEDLLVLSHADKRLWRGKPRDMRPSPYLGDIEQALIEISETRLRQRQPADQQLSLFS